jgi:hypothetical protein
LLVLVVWALAGLVLVLLAGHARGELRLPRAHRLPHRNQLDGHGVG